MVHLVQYHDEEASDDIAGNARSSPLSKFSQPAVAFWLKDGTNFTEYAHELEKSAQTHGLQQVGSSLCFFLLHNTEASKHRPSFTEFEILSFCSSEKKTVKSSLFRYSCFRHC